MIGIRYVSEGPIGEALKHAHCSEMGQMRRGLMQSDWLTSFRQGLIQISLLLILTFKVSFGLLPR
jgi:hypothetical protein